MGQVTFLLPKHLTETESRQLQQAHFVATYECVPVPTRTQLTQNRLTLEKEGNESNYVEVAWPIEEHGLIRLRTATLIEHQRPYNLLQELCRGKLNQIRLRLAQWEMSDIRFDDDLRQHLHRLIHQFSKSISDPLSDESVKLVTQTLSEAITLGDQLLDKIADHWLNAQAEEQGSCRIELAIKAIPGPEWKDTTRQNITALRLVPSWSRIEPSEYGYDWLEFDRLVEWAEATGLPLTIGPLIDFADSNLPEWLEQWNDDLPSLAAYAGDFIDTLIRRYHATQTTWYIFNGLNHEDRLGLNEDARIQLAARLLDAGRRIVPLGEWTIGIEQPWGDYLLDDQYTYSPLIFVDTLLRAGFQFNEISISIQAGIVPNTDQSRSLLDLFGLLELLQELGGRPSIDNERDTRKSDVTRDHAHPDQTW